MPTQLQENFDNFADEQNRTASLARMSRGMGVAPSIEVREGCEMRQVSAVINNTIEDSALRELLKTKIREILEQNGQPAISMLDIVTLGLTEPEQIKRYLRNYGIDLDKEDDKKYAEEVMREAIRFFDKHIEQNKIQELSNTNVQGIYHLFQTAAGKGKRMLTPYACALLRIMAVIDFINKNPLLSVLPKKEDLDSPDQGHVLTALKERLNRRIKREGRKTIFYPTGGESGDMGIELARVEVRIKERDRVIAKLLHKPGNKEGAVLDHIGARITTRTAHDAIRMLHEMFFHPANAIFPDMNIRVGRSKNKIIDIPTLRSAAQGNPVAIEKFMEELAEDTIDHEELTTVEDSEDTRNGHSSPKYRAIHITVDIPIKICDQQILFPIEIQLIDIQSRTTNEREAPHEGYVEKQMTAVKKRILGENILTKFNKERRRKD